MCTIGSNSKIGRGLKRMRCMQDLAQDGCFWDTSFVEIALASERSGGGGARGGTGGCTRGCDCGGSCCSCSLAVTAATAARLFLFFFFLVHCRRCCFCFSSLVVAPLLLARVDPLLNLHTQLRLLDQLICSHKQSHKHTPTHTHHTHGVSEWQAQSAGDEASRSTCVVWNLVGVCVCV